jgi:tRNA/tmRNA/rRNA uracil-C5-methylase (TrmA/RlmC/RlmD family)
MVLEWIRQALDASDSPVMQSDFSGNGTLSFALAKSSFHS